MTDIRHQPLRVRLDEALTGTPTAPTPALGDTDTKLAKTPPSARAPWV
jgi:hypothetical protein